MSFSPEPDFQGLQKSVVDLLIKIEALMQDASRILDTDELGQSYAGFQKEIAAETTKVQNLELRMAIVAPMKAGKSTIVNSIIGQDILPSRASAMTTLPTEISFKSALTEPILELSPEIISIFKDTILALKQKLKETQPSVLEEKLATHPHLNELVQQLREMVGFSIPLEVRGREKVVEVLTFLNDMVRLCSLIAPLADPLNQLEDVPRIHTPFWYSQGCAQSDYLGNLVIVDTPGPNEAGDNLKLGYEVKKQLQQCSIVLIVLDFTGLNTKAAAEIRQDVQKVIEVRGHENLYVLVNKVDQRREGDPMTPERIRQFVVADLGLEACGTEERVFEISARRAFAASSFLQELEISSNCAIADLKTARSLAQEVFGIDWEEDLEDVTLDELKRKAERLWKRSGFAPFLDKAIKALMAEAAPRCIETALTLSCDRLTRLQNTVRLRGSAINADEGRLRQEIGALAQDLEKLELCRKDLQRIDNLTNNLHRQLDGILEKLQKEAQISIQAFFSEEEMRQADIPKKLLYGLRRFLNQSEQEQYRVTGIIRFDSEREAEDFIELAIASLKQRIETKLEGVRCQVEVIIEQARTDLIARLNKQTRPIIESANERLNRTFNIELVLANPQMQSDVEFARPNVQRVSKTVKRYEKKVIQKRSFWHFLWLVPYEKEVQVGVDEVVTYATVSLKDIVSQVNQSIEESILEIKKGVTDYLDEDFQEQITQFFNNLDHYLMSYQDNLKQAQQDQQLAADQKSNLLNLTTDLDRRAGEALAEISKLDHWRCHRNVY